MRSPILALASHTSTLSYSISSISLTSVSSIFSTTMSSTWSSSFVSVIDTTTALPSQIASITNACSLPYQSDTSYMLDSISKSNVSANSVLVIPTAFSCTVSGTSTVAVVFSDGGVGNTIPTWGSVDQSANTLTFNVPYVSTDTTYTFSLTVTPTETPSVIYYVTVKLYVVAWNVSNWSTWTSNDNSKWLTWNSGYSLYNNVWTTPSSTSSSNSTSSSSNSTSAQKISETASAAATTSITTAGVGVVAAAGTSLLTLSSPQGMWSIINLFQTLTILLLTKAYFPEEATTNFSGMIQYTNFSFDFIPFPSVSFLSIIMNWFNLPVNGDLMTKVGLKSGSTFFNNISLLINILFVLFLHQMFLIIRRILCAKWKDKPWVKFVINKIYKFLTLCLYIRLMMEAYQFLLIWSTDEIHSFKTSTNSEITSLAIAILFFIILIAFTVFVLVLTIKQIYKGTTESSDNSQSYFDEIFDGTKDTKYSRFYSFMFIMRKALIIIFMLFLPRLNIIIKVGFFVFIQSLYYLYLILVRPLEKAKDNIIDVINEMLILLLVTMLFKYNKEPDWNSSSKMVFFISISIVNLIVSIICISKKDILTFWIFFSWFTD